MYEGLENITGRLKIKKKGGTNPPCIAMKALKLIHFAVNRYLAFAFQRGPVFLNVPAG